MNGTFTALKALNVPFTANELPPRGHATFALPLNKSLKVAFTDLRLPAYKETPSAVWGGGGLVRRMARYP